MQRVVYRTLPDGTPGKVFPFHISMEGMEKMILCRDDDDYDAMVKIICVAARRCNVIVVIYAVVSNHSHVAVLATTQQDANRYGTELKKMYSMWFARRYGPQSILRHTDVKAICLDSDWYVRNALAYIPRNALDNGQDIASYSWSSYRSVFRSQPRSPGVRRVSLLNKRERERIMHTGDDLRRVDWLLDMDGHLCPESFCDTDYLEQVYEHDPAFWLRTLGGLNAAEMSQKLVDGPRKMLYDKDFLLVVNDMCGRWFGCDILALPLEKKLRLLPYLVRTQKTTLPQLARTLSLERDTVRDVLRKMGRHRP